MSVRPEQVTAEVTPVVEAAGLDLETLEITSAGRRRLVRVVVDRDGGVTLDDVAEVSRLISERLDASEAMEERPYVLEVTSPGVDRPLTQPRHWRRATGRLVRVVLVDGQEVTGRVVGVDDTAATLDLGDRTQQVRLAEVARARVEVEFRRPDDDGGDGSGPEIEEV